MPPRKPIDEQTRNNTKEEIEKKKLAEEAVWVGDEQLDEPPKWLIDKYAVKEWHRLVSEFRKKQLISNLDYNNLAGYCNSYALYKAVSEELQLDIEIAMGDKELRTSYLKYAEDMRKFASTIGLTVQARLQSGTNAVGQQEKGIDDEFGGI